MHVRVPEELSGSDRPFEGAEWVHDLPPALRRVAQDLTYDEAHAALLGLLAIPLTAIFVRGGLVLDVVVGAVTLALFGVALFKLPRESGLFAHLLSSETWYFAVPFVVLSALTYVVLLAAGLGVL